MFLAAAPGPRGGGMSTGVGFGRVGVRASQVKGYLQIFPGWAYSDSVQERGVFPSLPALFLKRPLRLIKGNVYSLM